MALSVTHSTVVVTADDPNYEVGSNEWNAAHSVSGVLGAANGGTGVANNASSTIAISGAFGLTLTLSAATALTLPTSGTLATTSDKLSAFAATTSAELAGVISDETGSGALVFATSPTLVTPVLGTPASGTLTNCTGLPISSGVSGLAAGVATFLATPSSANLISAVTDETGTGSLVFATSPTLVTPALGTPASGTLTNCTGLPISTGVSGLAAGIATFLATPSSANLASAVTDETGTGSLVFGTSPTFTTGITVPLVIGGTGTGSTLTLESTSGAGTTDAIIFKTASQSERLRIATDGTVRIGDTSDSGVTRHLQILGLTADTSGISLARYSTSASVSPNVVFHRSRAGTVGSRTIVQSDDDLGSFQFQGDDGTNFVEAAILLVESDGTPGTNDMPGRFTFWTTADGASGATERLRIDSSGMSSFTHGTFGYGQSGNGDGGTVTQLTNKSTGVTLSTVSGEITMNGAALAANTTVTFTLTNTKIAATDHLLLHHQSAGTAGAYALNAQCAAGSATINVRNHTAGSLSEAIVISFVLIKGVTS